METLEKILEEVSQNKMTLILASTHSCSVCTAVEPIIKEIIEKYSEINYKHIYVDQMVEASGSFMIFTVPTVIVYAEGKEIHRQGRFIDFEELEFQINRWHEFLYS